MLTKQKEWCKEKVEKGKEWIERHKTVIAFGSGMAAMTGLHMLIKKLDEPKSGCISYSRCLEDETPDIRARIYYKNRFGKERNPMNIQYDYTSAELKELCDNLNGVVYPGD